MSGNRYCKVLAFPPDAKGISRSQPLQKFGQDSRGVCVRGSADGDILTCGREKRFFISRPLWWGKQEPVLNHNPYLRAG